MKPMPLRQRSGPALAPRERLEPEASEGGHTGRDESRASIRLRTLAATLHKAGQIVEALAEDAEIHLAESPTPRLIEQSMQFSGDSPKVQLLGTQEVAALLKVHPRSVRRWRHAGQFPAAFDLGGVLRWRREDIEAWLQERRES